MPVQAGHIYVADYSDNRVKVGFTRHPGRRLAALSGGSFSYLSELIEHPTVVEKEVHKRLKGLGLHIEKEYFATTAKHAEAIVREVEADAMAGKLDRDVSARFHVILRPEVVRALDQWTDAMLAIH